MIRIVTSFTRKAFVARQSKPQDLPDWLLTRGRHLVTTSEVGALLEVPVEHVSPTVARLVARGRLFSPTKGCYVPIPPEFREWGAVPASHFVDPLMAHLGHPYYVGLLSAAEVHGAAHQRPQVFQVVVDARVRDRSFGRVRMQFHTSSRVGSLPTVRVNTPTGQMMVATPEVTAFDVVQFVDASGGLSNAATVVVELARDGRLDAAELGSVAESYPASVVTRLGWILERLAGVSGLEVMRERAAGLSAPAPLKPGVAGGDLDRGWNLIVNAAVEVDV